MADKFKQQLDNAIRETDSKNAAHYVHHEIKDLHENKKPEDVRKRWIWELLQNAYDERGADGITAEVRYNAEEEELVFLHNGLGFEANQIVHIIKGGNDEG